MEFLIISEQKMDHGCSFLHALCMHAVFTGAVNREGRDVKGFNDREFALLVVFIMGMIPRIAKQKMRAAFSLPDLSITDYSTRKLDTMNIMHLI